MKKVVIVILAAILIASCAGRKTVEEFDLEIVTFFDDTASAEAFAAIVSQFEKQFKLRVYVESIPEATYYSSLEQYMTSEYPPDILSFHPGWHFRNYAAKGLFQTLEPLMPGRTFEKTYPVQFKETSSYHGSVFFAPLSWTWWSMYYNKNVFTEAKIKIPASLEDLLALAPQLRKTGFIPFTASAKDSRTLSAWLGLFLSATEDPELYRSFCSGSAAFNNAKIQGALQQFAVLIKNKYIIDSAAMLSRDQALGPLLSGRAALYLADSGILKNLPKEERENIGVAAFPGYKGMSMVYTDIEGFAVHAKAKHKANAQKFLTFIAAPEIQQAMSLPFSRLPANLAGQQKLPELETAKALLSGTKITVVTMEQNMPAAAAAAVLSELGNIFTLPGNLQLYLQNLEAKRVEIFRIKN